MSLLHLLTVADSLHAPKTGHGRFRMAQQSLPKFAPAKHPVSLRPAVPARTEFLTGETRSLFEPRPDACSATPKTECVTGLNTAATVSPFLPLVAKEKADKPVMETPATPAPENGAAAKPRAPRIFRESSWLRRRPGGTREREVQTEWALERVTVIRNDLSDTDLEVVAARREETKAGPFTLEAPVPRKRMAGLGWLRMAGRLILLRGIRS